MIKVKELLKHKGVRIWSTHPKSSLFDAMKIMSKKDIGALPVMDKTGLIGIISERDIVRELSKSNDCDLTKTVDQIMTKKVITTTSDATLETCMKIMTENHIRHLPIMDNNQLMGLISIGDVVRDIVQNRNETINQLENYIVGAGYGH